VIEQDSFVYVYFNFMHNVFIDNKMTGQCPIDLVLRLFQVADIVNSTANNICNSYFKHCIIDFD